jgi:hypothetical protein
MGSERRTNGDETEVGNTYRRSGDLGVIHAARGFPPLEIGVYMKGNSGPIKVEQILIIWMLTEGWHRVTLSA